ncbi:MAG: nucleotide sugar dehydrogenase, partial [Deltaproteobacteria bacterium]
MFEKLLKKIENKEAVVGVIGLGYVGLPLLIQFVKQGFQGIGFDIDSKKVNALLHGESYIKHVPIEPVNDYLKQKRLDVTISFDRLAEADCIVICVPTPLTDKMDPDLRFLVSTSETIAKVIRPGQLVVLESTTYPG